MSHLALQIVDATCHRVGFRPFHAAVSPSAGSLLLRYAKSVTLRLARSALNVVDPPRAVVQMLTSKPSVLVVPFM